MEWFIKSFQELDTKELYSILMERINVFVVEQNCPYPECDGKDEKSYHMFAKEGHEIIAYLRILPPGVNFNEASIGRLLVKKNYRGKDIAKEMLKGAIKFIEDILREKKIKLSAQQYLINFYNEFGFKIVSEGYLEDGIPHIDMVYERGET